MEFLWFIIIGLVAGFLAGRIMKGSGFGLVINLLVGIAGSILGGWIFGHLGISFGADILGSLITALLGAIILLFLLRIFKKR